MTTPGPRTLPPPSQLRNTTCQPCHVDRYTTLYQKAPDQYAVYKTISGDDTCMYNGDHLSRFPITSIYTTAMGTPSTYVDIYLCGFIVEPTQCLDLIGVLRTHTYMNVGNLESAIRSGAKLHIPCRFSLPYKTAAHYCTVNNKTTLISCRGPRVASPHDTSSYWSTVDILSSM